MCRNSPRWLTTLVGVGSVAFGTLVCSAQIVKSEPQAANDKPAPAAGFPVAAGQNPTLFPAIEFRALPAARAAAVATSAMARRTESDLNLTLLDLRRAAASSPDLVDAVAEEHAAWDDLRAAREKALKDLRADPTYQSTLELRDRLAEQLDQARHNPDATPAQIRALAEAKLARATTISSMENAAIGASAAVRDARARLVIAGERVAHVRKELDEGVRRNTDVRELRKTVQDTKIAAVAAEAYFVEARNIAEVALGYAYDVQRYPRPYVYHDPYPWYGDVYPPVISTGYPIGYPMSWRAGNRP